MYVTCRREMIQTRLVTARLRFSVVLVLPQLGRVTKAVQQQFYGVSFRDGSPKGKSKRGPSLPHNLEVRGNRTHTVDLRF